MSSSSIGPVLRNGSAGEPVLQKTFDMPAMAQLANVKSAYAQASKQLRSATVRAPFAGVIATKVVSAGDVVHLRYGA